MRSPVTRDTYLRRLKIFFNHIQLLSNKQTMEVRCNLFVDKSRSSSTWAFSTIFTVLQFQKKEKSRKKRNISSDITKLCKIHQTFL